MEIKRFLGGLFFIIAGLILVLNSQVLILGAIIGLSPVLSSTSLILGLAFLIMGILLMLKSRTPSILEYTLEEICGGETPKRFRKSAEFLGKSMVKSHYGTLPSGTKDEKRSYTEAFNIIEMEKNRDALFKKDAETGKTSTDDYSKIYVRHEPKGGLPELGLREAITYDAKSLSTGHRGKYRYIFDKNGKYIGLAEHWKSSGKTHYQWAH